MIYDILNIHGEYFVSDHFLKSNGVKERTIYNGTSKFNMNKSRRWENFKSTWNDHSKFIKYKSIPDKTLKKLPSLNEIDYLFKTQVQKKKDIELDAKYKDIYYNLLNSSNHKYKFYYSIYERYFSTRDEIIKHSKTHAIIEGLLHYHKHGIHYPELFKIFNQIENLTLKITSPKYFAQKLIDAKKDSVENILVHNNIGNISNNRKLTEKHISFIKHLYRNPKKFTYSYIHQKLNEYCIENNLQLVTLSTVKRILASKEIQAECKPFRNGLKWTKENILPKLYRKDPLYPGDVWQLDGTRFQFAYLNKEGKPKTIVFFVVLDVFSRKVIGYSYDTNENSKMIIKALRMAIENTKYLPYEIVHDNFSAFNEISFSEFIEITTAIGTEWRRASVGNPQDKGHVESFFKVFQSVICRPIDGYLGEGIKTKNENGKPAPELENEFLKKKNLRTKSELVELLDKLIYEYNNTKINDKQSASNKYESKSPQNVTILSKPQIAILFYKKTTLKVQNSSIYLTVKKLKYRYIIPEDKLVYYNTSVTVAFDENYLDEIYLFNPDNEAFIMSLKGAPEISSASVYHTPKDKKTIKDFKEQEKSFLNELTLLAKSDIEIIGEEYNDDATDLMISQYSKKERIKEVEDLELKSKTEQSKKARISLKENKNINEDKLESKGDDFNLYRQKATLEIVDE